MFVGFRRDVSRILATLDIFVSVSAKEGLGVSLLEAGSYGVPIVATNVGGIPEIVQDGVTGFLVPPRDSKALTEKTVYMLAHRPEANIMGQQAKEWVRSNFSVEQMADSYVLLYESVTETE